LRSCGAARTSAHFAVRVSRAYTRERAAPAAFATAQQCGIARTQHAQGGSISQRYSARRSACTRHERKAQRTWKVL
jgi:hypothetical protein